MITYDFTDRRIGAGLTFLMQAVVGVVLLIAVISG